MKFWNFIKNTATETTPETIELRIDGDIVGEDAWIYEWLGIPVASPNSFRKELNQYKGKDITVWIDSYGGDVFAAAGIYNALKEHDGKVTVKVDGKAMSAASVIAMAGDEVLMSPVGIMMIHNPLMQTQGDMRDLRKAADVLDTVKDTIINAYALKTRKSKNKISTMMDDESYMSANVAVKEGFADGVLYSDDSKKTDGIKDFAFSKLLIQNDTNEAVKRMLDIMQKNNIQSEKEEDIVDLKELKDKYPDIYKAAFDEGKQDGTNTERERLKGIDEIAKNADQALINKAKYEDPIDVRDLAVKIVMADNAKGDDYLDDLQEDNKKSNVKEIKPAIDKPDDKKLEASQIKNAASKIASFFSKK